MPQAIDTIHFGFVREVCVVCVLAHSYVLSNVGYWGNSIQRLRQETIPPSYRVDTNTVLCMQMANGEHGTDDMRKWNWFDSNWQ